MELRFRPTCLQEGQPNEKTKGVDISLTKDMLSHAFHKNYDAVGLVAGDADYIPLVEEVKRHGKVVYVVFFRSEGLSPELRRSADKFVDIGPFFAKQWTKR